MLRTGVALRCVASRHADCRDVLVQSGGVHNFFSMSPNSARRSALGTHAAELSSHGADVSIPLAAVPRNTAPPALLFFSSDSLPSAASLQVNSTLNFRADVGLNRLASRALPHDSSDYSIVHTHTLFKFITAGTNIFTYNWQEILVVCLKRIRDVYELCSAQHLLENARGKWVLQVKESTRTAAVLQVQVTRLIEWQA